MKILLMGNPNVGKSAFFSRLTGINVVISNYSGTTVEYKKGYMPYKKESAELIDVPGTYSLKPTNKAEEVAVRMLKEGDLIINVVDSTNLERNLNLTFQLMERKIPMVVALNMSDEAKHIGIEINIKRLEKLLRVPVIPTVAITGQGIKSLMDGIYKAKSPRLAKQTDSKRWGRIGNIVQQVQKTSHKHHTIMERISDASIKPFPGIFFALAAMILSFFIVRFIGENLIRYVFDPLFQLYYPIAMWMSGALGSGFLHNLIIGNLINGKIDFLQSTGLLTTALYVPIGMVLPYIFAFYLILGIWEDSGYLPRLAVLSDSLIHTLGLHGFAVIPMLLGMGCKVTGAMSTRILESRKEKFIAATLMAICVPCMSQTAMIIGLLGKYGIKGLGIVFLTLFIVWSLLGFILNKLTKGKAHEIFMEISPYRLPHLPSMIKKLYMRTRYYITEAMPYIFLGVLLVNLLYTTGIITWLGKLAAPVLVNIFGLPSASIGALIMGFLRKDIAVGMLIPLGLTLKQLIIASVVMTMYFPCIATFVILFKELGWKDMVKSTFIMIITTLIVGGVLNLVL